MVDRIPTTSGPASDVQSPPSGSGASAEPFSNEWYIHVKSEFQLTSLSQIKVKLVSEFEENVVDLHQGKYLSGCTPIDILTDASELKTCLSEHQVQLLPHRFVTHGKPPSSTIYTCYWLIGLPSIPSAELSDARKFLKEWQNESSKSLCPRVRHTVHARFVPQKTILDQNLKEDVSEMLASTPASQSKTKQRTGDTFKKNGGSNPAQVRKQFLQHAMDGDLASAYPQISKGKLRPPREVLNRLRFDEGYDLDAYVIGCIDRHSGILEKPVAKWQEYEEMELIAYFKHVPTDEIVWDRSRKLDLIFNA
jgi:uncharacterized protein (UPF0248 family)